MQKQIQGAKTSAILDHAAQHTTPSSQLKAFGRYIILERIAVGGMAELFLGLRSGPAEVEKLLVIKSLFRQYSEDRDFVRLFYREAALSCLLQHPNIVQTWDALQIGNRHAMVMDFLKGVTAEQLLHRAVETKRDKALPIDVAIWICINALEGLHYLHQLCHHTGYKMQCIHRDITPSNIFVCYDGSTKLFDFGIAQFAFNSSDSDPHHGMLAGKYAYMSPEQARGEALDLRSDIFTMALVLYELTTGKKAFERGNDIKTLDALLREDIVDPQNLDPHFPTYLSKVIHRALAKEANKRYRSALDFAQDLRKFLKISGLKPTDHTVSDYVASLFAKEIKALESKIASLITQARHAFPPTDPLANLAVKEDSAIDEHLDSDILLIPEGLGVEDLILSKNPLPFPDKTVAVRETTNKKDNSGISPNLSTDDKHELASTTSHISATPLSDEQNKAVSNRHPATTPSTKTNNHQLLLQITVTLCVIVLITLFIALILIP